MDRRVLDVLKTLREHHRFMKGLFAWTGFKTCTVDYACCTRIIGESKFNIWLLWKLAIEGITSFSTLPLTIWLYIGSLFSFCSFLYGLIIFFRTLFLGVELPGYASQICLISFWGGLQLLGIGILGEYIGRIYIESKHRPPYVVRRLYNISL